MAVSDAIDDPVEPWTPPAGPPDAARRLRAELRAAEAEVARLRTALVEAEARAERDALTGLLNRRGFDRELARTLATCRRYGGEASLIYLDLDGFKAVNDRFGHAAGDQVLTTVARVLSAAVRESDVVARLGGDEFAVILNHAGQAAAEVKAANLAHAVATAPMEGRSRVGLSWGVRSFEPGLDAPRMVAEADAAMFVRKGERRRA